MHTSCTPPTQRTSQAGTKASLALVFKGCLNDKMAGFYRSKYTSQDGEERYMAVTQFEATDARRAFPCWDEPARKATFSVEMVVPDGRKALSNMPVVSSEELAAGGTTVVFDKTPIMSTYLLAFVVGEFEKITDKTESGVEVNVWTPMGLTAEGEFPMMVACKTLDYFTKFFDEAYPLPKMDMIAISDFAAGAMENWGLVTYRSTLLLYNEARTSLVDKQRIAYVVCHELAHQWFGNLVTMEWWTHLWLNEGFATWVGWLAVDHIFPEWKIWEQFIGNEFESALELDSLRSSHPIEVECKTSADVNEIFDAISYSKGASVIRMLVSVLSVETFQTGLRIYLKKHKYGNALSEDLWDALTVASKQDVKALMNTWTRETGYPVLKLSLAEDGDTVVGEQQRFFATGPTSEETPTWPIPLGAFGANGAVGEKIWKAKQGPIGATLTGSGGWIKANATLNTLYRVGYSNDLLAKLSPHVKTLSATDRVGLVSDAFALAKAGYGDTVETLQLLANYKGETSYIVLSAIRSGFADLQSIMFQQPAAIQAGLKRFSLKLFAPVMETLGWDVVPDEPHEHSMLRPMALMITGQ